MSACVFIFFFNLGEQIINAFVDIENQREEKYFD